MREVKVNVYVQVEDMDMINDSKNPSPAHLLDPSPEQIRSWANAAVELMAEYLGTIRNRRVYPYTSSRQIRERLDSSLPKEPVNFDELLHTLRSTLIELSRHNGHPRMFGYVQAPGTAIAAFADLLSSTLNANLTAGHLPICVVANAGTVATGAFDPLSQIGEIARRFNLWLHVDGAYGGFAALAPSARPLFASIGEADSVALDPHKWLYLPVDCGCILYRDPEAARATFAHEAEYTRVIGQEADEAFAFWDYGPELSRRFRALKVWMLLKGVGLQALSEAIERDLVCARHFEKLVQNSEDFEMLAPVELSIFCFRHLPARLKGALATASPSEREKIEEQLDAHNERLLLALQRDGSSYVSNARLRGRFSLRGCVMNYRTTLRDREIVLDDLRRVAARL